MIFVPLHGHVEVKPIQINSIVATTNEVYEEKGEVISVAYDVVSVHPKQIVYFDGWRAAKFTDSKGEVRWLVPEENIRAVEKVEWKVAHQHGG